MAKNRVRAHTLLVAFAIGATTLAACGSTIGALAVASRAVAASAGSVIHDPDNPYWRMSTAVPGSYADPVRGPK